MPVMEVDLEQLLKTIEQLDSRELEILRERIPLITPTLPPTKDSMGKIQRDEFFTLPFKEYLVLSDEEREHIQLSVYQSHREWIDSELENRRAEWILVCGGEAIESSETLRNYPSREKLMALGEKRGVVPFVFVKAPLPDKAILWGRVAMPTLQAKERRCK